MKTIINIIWYVYDKNETTSMMKIQTLFIYKVGNIYNKFVIS